MTSPLTDKELTHLLEFVGYGSLNASFWFLGMEEGGGGESNLRTRLQFDTIEDCAKAHRLLGVTKYHSGRRNIQPTWRAMCYIILAMSGQEPTQKAIRNYQAESLGHSDGETLLVELMPIPKKAINDWGYEKIMPQFTSSKNYYDVVRPMRITLLQKIISSQEPRLILCYGKKYWKDYKQLFSTTQFATNDKFEVGHSETTLVVLTDHLTARSMNGKLDEVVELICSNLK